MADISKLKAAVVEKQEIILNQLTELPYRELVQLMASLSSIIANLDKALAEEEVQCNKAMLREMEKDPRVTVTKAEVALKATDLYLSYKNIMSLKQFAVRGLNLVRLHAEHSLISKVEDTSEEEVHEGV